MTLPVSNVVNVQISRETTFPTGPGFGTLLILGSSAIIPLVERIRFYSSIEGVAADFGTGDEEYKAALAAFSQNPRPERIAIGRRDTGNSADTELDAIQAVSDEWYGIVVTSEARGATSDVVAAWAEARTKLFIALSNDVAMVTTGNGGQGATLQAAGYNRTGIFYHDDSALYPDASFMGAMLTVDFDGQNTTKTGKFRQLPGITTTALTQSELDELESNDANAYVSIAGRAMTVNGTMASGEFFDVMHGVDWLQSEIAFRVFGALAGSATKIAYTRDGQVQLETQVRLALLQGVRNGLLAAQFDDAAQAVIPAFEIQSASIEDASAAQRANRQAPAITFTARLAGAVHTVQVNGTVTV